MLAGAALVALFASVPAAHAAEAASAPPSSGAGMPPERHRSDRWITTKVRVEIVAVSVNQSIHVHIRTVHGVVTLTGQVASADIVEQFTHAAKRPVGVRSVEASGLTVAVR
ncbi:MAG: BON domain-containing protein [Roseateles sp.]